MPLWIDTPRGNIPFSSRSRAIGHASQFGKGVSDVADPQRPGADVATAEADVGGAAIGAAEISGGLTLPLDAGAVPQDVWPWSNGNGDNGETEKKNDDKQNGEERKWIYIGGAAAAAVVLVALVASTGRRRRR